MTCRSDGVFFCLIDSAGAALSVFASSGLGLHPGEGAEITEAVDNAPANLLVWRSTRAYAPEFF
jgi:hypothetical protein